MESLLWKAVSSLLAEKEPKEAEASLYL